MKIPKPSCPTPTPGTLGSTGGGGEGVLAPPPSCCREGNWVLAPALPWRCWVTGPKLPCQDLSFPDTPGVRDLGICCAAPGIRGRWFQHRPSESDTQGMKSQFLSCWLSDLGHGPPLVGASVSSSVKWSLKPSPVLSQFQFELANEHHDSPTTERGAFLRCLPLLRRHTLCC